MNYMTNLVKTAVSYYGFENIYMVSSHEVVVIFPENTWFEILDTMENVPAYFEEEVRVITNGEYNPIVDYYGYNGLTFIF